jgi:hypothetical protein
MEQEAPRKSFVVWLALPLAMALCAYELSAPWVNGKQPDWMVVGLCAALVLWIALVRPLLMRKR